MRHIYKKIKYIYKINENMNLIKPVLIQCVYVISEDKS